MTSLPENIQPVLRVMPRPRDTNTAGDIFGGWIMSQVDLAGAVVATQRARGRVVTVAVNEFQFKKPVFIGDVVSFYAEIKKVGTTSITIDVTVYAERGLHSGKFGHSDKVTEALLTYVALDENHRPRQLPAAED
ncbi:MAG: acyl-CoA thioesterase [Acidiferrobacterales bacterium]